MEEAVHIGSDNQAVLDNMAHPQVVTISNTFNCTAWLAASNVLVTAAHCVDANGLPAPNGGVVYLVPGDTPFVPLPFGSIVADNSPTEASTALLSTFGVNLVTIAAHPSYAGGFAGTDIAVIVSSRSISRKILKPLKVASLTAEPQTPMLLGGGNTNEDCDSGGPSAITRLFLEPGLGTDQDGFPTVEFDYDDSEPCPGDSGGPILSTLTDSVLSLASMKGGDGGDDLLGPALWMENGAVRDWLVTNALDLDLDGIEAADDNCDTVPNFDQLDSDGDGVGDACDICPDEVNDEVDTDDDQLVDCIDPCPTDKETNDDDHDGCANACDPCTNGSIDGNLSMLPGFIDESCGDVDFDGVCNSVDNCIDVYNDTQVNTNALSESFYTQTQPWGDACEPVPQPRASADVPTTTVLLEVDHPYFHDVTTLSVSDHILVQPLRSQRMPQASPANTWLASKDVLGVPTHFRFCQPRAGVVCTDSVNVADSKLELQLGSASFEDPSMPYHRVTMGFGNGTPKAYNYTSTFTWSETWDYKADAAFWSATGIVTVPPGELLGGPASGLAGTFWLNAETAVGSSSVNVGTGVHGDQIANHYFPLDPEQVTNTHQAFPIPPYNWCFSGPGCELFFFNWRFLPYPPDFVSNVLPGEDGLLVATPGGNWGLMQRDGSAEVVTEKLGAHLLASLGDPSLRWANASEVSIFAGVLDAPIAIALSGDGGSLAETISIAPSGDSLLGELDRAAGGTPVAPLQTQAPHACQGFAVAYSRYFRSAYAVGDDDGVTHARTGGIWRYSLDAAAWSKLPTTIAVGTALAATVSFRDRGLYVLDETLVGGVAVARLLRFDAIRGGGAVLGTWPRQGLFDKLWLQLDHEGRVLLVASSAAQSRGKAFRIRTGMSPPQVAAIYNRSSPLAWPLVVDGRGMVSYRRQPSGVVSVTREPSQNFPVGWVDVGEVL